MYIKIDDFYGIELANICDQARVVGIPGVLYVFESQLVTYFHLNISYYGVFDATKVGAISWAKM